MSRKYFRVYSILGVLLVLQACAAAVVTGGAASTASVANDRRTAGTVIEDQAIELKAGQAFHNDKDIFKQAHWNVTSYNTIVLVTGEAPDEELRQRMIDIVRNIPKVTHVYNEITIAAPSSLMSRSSDTLITAKVKSKLLSNENTEGLRIKVVTENGTVYLMGILYKKEAELATDITRKTGGVQKVVKLFQYLD
ncbi:MAG: BON domain-containing protein [Gammaproteobacteria bacterium]